MSETLCPHCGNAFAKPPQRKTKCKSCGNVVLVRTRPSDRRRVLVTAAQAAALEEEWLRKYEYAKVIRTDRPGFDAEKAILTQRFGRSPKDTDVTWSILNKERLCHAAESKWGLYRNNTLDMADVLRVEGRLEGAVRFYLEVCYIDLNGPNNIGPISDPRLRVKYPPFSPDLASLASGVVHLLARACAKTSMTDDALRSIFFTQVVETTIPLDLPVSPEAAWQVIHEALVKIHETSNDRARNEI